VIDPGTTVGTVRLTVRDLDRSRSFYEQVLGLTGDEALGAPGGPTLIELHGDPLAPALNPRATGLFHLAVLVPTRADLADSLKRIASARWPLSGASDHLVSEALYLSDPDGNGIEIYRDRPREQWPERDGQLQMATIPLDLDDLVRDSPADDVPAAVPVAARMGHVHLQVSDLDEAERFYSGKLGFDVTVRGYPGALFFSAGGYHHHIGVNTWHSAGSAPPEPGAVGLRNFDVVLPGASALAETLQRVDGDPLVHGPSGIGVRLTAA
jgi:catechol 2,3-dioxygenase